MSRAHLDEVAATAGFHRAALPLLHAPSVVDCREHSGSRGGARNGQARRAFGTRIGGDRPSGHADSSRRSETADRETGDRVSCAASHDERDHARCDAARAGAIRALFRFAGQAVWAGLKPGTTAGITDCMRILYSAIDQPVPAAHGGSVHVTAVAEGLAELGHEVHVLVSPGDRGEIPTGKARWFAVPPPFGQRRLRLLRAREVASRARQFQPEVVIERYYNFGGEGVLAATKVGALVVLEVNAPVVDHPGSLKADRRPRSHRRADAALARLAVPSR